MKIAFLSLVNNEGKVCLSIATERGSKEIIELVSTIACYFSKHVISLESIFQKNYRLSVGSHYAQYCCTF